MEEIATLSRGFPGGDSDKVIVSANAGDIRDTALISGLGRSSGEGNDNPLQYSCLEISMDKSQTGLKKFSM